MQSPVSRAEMVPSPAPDEKALRKAMADAEHTPAYSQRFIEKHLDKERELGVIHKDPATGYITRVKAGS